jgi:hypothetical protein
MEFSELFNLTDTKKSAYMLGLIYSWPMIDKNNTKILAYSSYKTGSRSEKHISNIDIYFKKHKEKLANFLGSDFVIKINSKINYDFDKTKGQGVSVIFNFDNTNKSEIFLYGQIEKWLSNQTQKTKEFFLIGVFDGRGSLDFSGKFITLDADKQEDPQVVKRKINTYSDIVGLIYNYNPRILQPNSKSKNDQFRLDVYYFMQNFGLLNPFKIKYYCTETNIQTNNNDFFIDKTSNIVPNKITGGKNLKINQFAIELNNRNLNKNEKLKLIKEYRDKFFDSDDSDDEVLNASVNVKNTAKAKANYKCEINDNHVTFTAKNNNQYVEGHHLIPFAKRDEFDVNIDIVENIVALCPNCHRKIHNAIQNERNVVIKNLFDIRKDKLKNNGVDISLSDLKNFYQ